MLNNKVQNMLNKLIQLFHKKIELPAPVDLTKNSIQDSMDCLKVYIEYTLFDLEATRRENEMLKKKVRELEK